MRLTCDCNVLPMRFHVTPCYRRLVAGAPLATFENSRDYVFDAQWSPSHPAVFASVNGAGQLDVWNVNADCEAPAASLSVQGGALSSLRWAPGGRKIYVGDARG